MSRSMSRSRRRDRSTSKNRSRSMNRSRGISLSRSSSRSSSGSRSIVLAKRNVYAHQMHLGHVTTTLSEPGHRLRADDSSNEIGADAQALIRACLMRNDLKHCMITGKRSQAAHRPSRKGKRSQACHRTPLRTAPDDQNEKRSQARYSTCARVWTAVH